jgi:hypothetical protein
MRDHTQARVRQSGYAGGMLWFIRKVLRLSDRSQSKI